MHIGETIRMYRERDHLSQQDLGRSLDVSAQAISKWELGKAEPDINALIKMCDVFCVTADELLGRKAPPREQVDSLIAGLAPDQQLLVKMLVGSLKQNHRQD